MTEQSFAELIRRVRDGQEAAASELVQRFGPRIRDSVRKRLTDLPLRRLIDSEDICQSTLGKFFLEVRAGKFDLEKPENLVRVLTTMAHHKLLNEVEKQRTAKRDIRRMEPAKPDDIENLASQEPSPSWMASAKELMAKARHCFSPFERFLAEQREQDRTWKAIAADVGCDVSDETLRKRWERARERVMQQLDLKES